MTELKTRTCKECGKEFIGYENKKYCSQRCYRRANRKASGCIPLDVPRKCPVCGKEFQARSPNHQYCSDECKKKEEASRYVPKRGARKEYKARSPVTKTCPICGKEFQTTCSGKIYCSDKCRTQKRPAVELEPRACEYCGGMFTPPVSYQKYCCDMCRKKVKRQRDRDNRRERARAQAVERKAEKAAREAAEVDRKKNQSNIVEVNRKAQLLGLDYGEYKSILAQGLNPEDYAKKKPEMAAESDWLRSLYAIANG